MTKARLRFLVAAAALAPAAAPLRAAPSVEVRIKQGDQTYVQRAALGAPAFNGRVESADGSSARTLMVEFAPGPAEADGTVPVEYQMSLNLIGTNGAPPIFTDQARLRLRPGEAMTAVQCGEISLRFTLSGEAKAGRAGNHRVAAKVKTDDGGAVCSHLTAPSALFSLAAPLLVGDARRAFAFSAAVREPSGLNSPLPPGALSTVYHAGLSAGAGSDPFDSRSQFVSRPGQTVSAARCGSNALDLTVDAGDAAPVTGFHLTAEVASGGATARCSSVADTSAHAMLTSGLTVGDQRRNLTFDILLIDAPALHDYVAESKLALAPRTGGGGFKANASPRLVPGRWADLLKGPGGAASVRLDGSRGR